MSFEIGSIRSLNDLNAPAVDRAQEEELGKTAFLELMIAQISNQDPLEPAKNDLAVIALGFVGHRGVIEDIRPGRGLAPPESRPERRRGPDLAGPMER